MCSASEQWIQHMNVDQPSQGQVIIRRTRAAITQLRLSLKEEGMLMPLHVPSLQ